MKTLIVGLQAETFVHPGCGRDMGAVDLPVAREAATDLPFVAGSSVKGAFKDWAHVEDGEGKKLFGEADRAGQLLFGDARLLALPVRSLDGAYKWVTSPLLIERLLRDLRRAGTSLRLTVPKVAEGDVLCQGEGTLFLEELMFQISATPDSNLLDLVRRFLPHPESRDRLPGQLAVLSDTDFTWFARHGLAVQARNVLEDGSKKSKNLWYEETLPPDTLMYTLVASRDDEALERFAQWIDEKPQIQLGGNETVGQGWLTMTVLKQEG